VPAVRATFRANGSFYLVTEHIRGRPLQAVIGGKQRLSRRRILTHCLQMCRIVAGIHAAGWVWADCKPANFLCGARGRLRAHDFEGAFRQESGQLPGIATPGFVPPRRHRADPRADDLFALGASMAQLVTRKEKPPRSLRLPRLGPKLPAALLELIRSLKAADPASRPPAAAAARAVGSMLARRGAAQERRAAARPA
jgi:serine/threonine protein kinase